MKKICLFLSCIALFVLLSFTVSADEPIWYFNNEADITQWKPDGLNVSLKDGYYLFVPTGADPQMMISIPDAKQFSADEYPYIAFRMKAVTELVSGGFFFGTSTNPGPAGPEFSIFDVVPGEWHDYIVNMAAYKHGKWTGKVNKIRIDPINNPNPSGGEFSTTDEIYIDRIGAFRTEADAKAFLAKGVDKKQEEDVEIINSGAESPKWIFNGSDDYKNWSLGGGSLYFEFGLIKFLATGKDLTFTCAVETPFDGDEFRFFAYRYKANTQKNSGGLFFTSDTITTFRDEYFSGFTIKGNNEWNNIVVDMKSFLHKGWGGKIKTLRLDPINPTDEGDETFISRIGFFRSKADAEAFLAEANDSPNFNESVCIDELMQSSIIPGGTITGDFNKADYMLSSTVPVGEGKSAPVVTCTDKNGNKSIVALSNTNSNGYTKFVARKAGNYTLGYNHKDFSDLSTHWGSDYINYVSDRKLFGGTSETEFSPDMTMTRGMFITVLGRMHGLDITPYNGETGYADVNQGEYYAPYIQWAKEYSIMKGLSDVTFGAEDPISRVDMAVVIANYVAAYKYKFNKLSDPAEFTDVSECTDEAKTAISLMQSTGIINGKEEGLFDPKGISTRAEVATVMSRVIKAVLGVNYYSTFDEKYWTGTHDRIRFGAWGDLNPLAVNDEYIKTMKDLGYDMILCMPKASDPVTREKMLFATDKYGIKVYVNDNAYLNPIEATAAYFEHPSYAGQFVIDEPGTEDMLKNYEACADYMKKTGKEIYINLLPSYANAAQLKYGQYAASIEFYDSDPDLYKKYVEDFVAKYDVSYVSTDIYPLRRQKNTNRYTTYNGYIESISKTASVAREAGREFWCYMNTHASGGTNKPISGTKELKWQSYSLLSFGCNGFLTWTTCGDSFDPSILDGQGNPTDGYRNIKPVFAELKKISDVYMQYKNLGAFNHKSSADVPYLNFNNQYTNFAPIKEIKCDDPLLIGCFEKKEGLGNAFTLVNMTPLLNDKEISATLKIEGKVTAYFGGKPILMTNKDGWYTFPLTSGEGVFVTVE